MLIRSCIVTCSALLIASSLPRGVPGAVFRARLKAQRHSGVFSLHVRAARTRTKPRGHSEVRQGERNRGGDVRE